jgi:hypothetical protein
MHLARGNVSNHDPSEYETDHKMLRGPLLLGVLLKYSDTGTQHHEEVPAHR